MSLKIGILSDTTYRACTPDYENNLSFYGSEPYHAQIAKAFVEHTNHEVEFFAPQGSEPIGKFHPLRCYNGSYIENEILENTSLEGLTTKYFIDEEFDFILDYTAVARTIEDLRNFYGFLNYGVFRNGYTGYAFPRLRLDDRHYILPSHQNRRVFENHGFRNISVCYYPVPDFYCEGEDENYINLFRQNNLENTKYFLYPHRPTSEKGSYSVLELARYFPNEIFVFMVSNNPVRQHMDAMLDLKRKVIQGNLLHNVRFVDLPLNNKHHYYKRELMRHAKAILSPFNPAEYMEGFGLANAEAVACGTPILISDSESSRELWRDEIDGLIIPYDDRLWGFKMAIKHLSSYNFAPENRYTVEKSIKSYEDFISNILVANSEKTERK